MNMNEFFISLGCFLWSAFGVLFLLRVILWWEIVLSDNPMVKWIKDVIHNCIVHPLMPFLSVQLATRLHDHNANWAFSLERYDELALENGGDNQKIDLIEAAIKKYYLALDRRQNGDKAQNAAFSEIQQILGIHWEQGKTLAETNADD